MLDYLVDKQLNGSAVSELSHIRAQIRPFEASGVNPCAPEERCAHSRAAEGSDGRSSGRVHHYISSFSNVENRSRVCAISEEFLLIRIMAVRRQWTWKSYRSAVCTLTPLFGNVMFG